MEIHEILTTARAPWQNAYVERFIGTVRRECLDHLIIFNESSLKRMLTSYFEYYEHSRTHLSLEKDPPTSRAVQGSDSGRVVELPQVGGLHHRYERRAA
jgi:putative transposase